MWGPSLNLVEMTYDPSQEMITLPFVQWSGGYNGDDEDDYDEDDDDDYKDDEMYTMRR